MVSSKLTAETRDLDVRDRDRDFEARDRDRDRDQPKQVLRRSRDRDLVSRPTSLVVDDYVYLGVKFHYNGSFKKAISKQVTQARKALFGMLSKARSLVLPIDIQCELFDKTVLPVSRTLSRSRFSIVSF